MKTSLCTPLESRLLQAAGLLAVMAVIAVSSAWSGPNERRVKLEGAWIAQIVENGIRALLTYVLGKPIAPSQGGYGEKKSEVEFSSLDLEDILEQKF